MDVNAYLERINYSGSLATTLETLRALHVAHLMTVPFENLDIPLDRPILLNDEALFVKIVEQRRGGFCYELNGLFANLLRTLGFSVEMLPASFYDAEGDHLGTQGRFFNPLSRDLTIPEEEKSNNNCNP